MSDNSNAVVDIKIPPVSIESEMEQSYLDYAMSVIVSRALPDCRDGLKPVHRRILYSMYKSGNHHDKPYRKSARIVGDVISTYHPHGTDPIYGSLVRMAQTWSLRDVLVDGQGNFGSVDGDMPAAMRYTEVRMTKIGKAMLENIWQDTVNFQDNYDHSEQEPCVLPVRFPNLLVNGASGIAVGMATNIPTHNLGEVMEGCRTLLRNPDTSMEELLKIIPGPDFPTGGIIVDARKALDSMATGRGQVIVRAKVHEEQIGARSAIIVTELPYQVNKAELLKKIQVLSKEKVIEGIAELRDESNKLGNRVVIELKRDADYSVVLNHLYQYTPMQSSFATNMLALHQGRPEMMNIKRVILAFIDFRKEVVQRRTRYLLKTTREKAHVLIGLSLALANIDEIIKLIRQSSDTAAAREALMEGRWDASTVIPLMKLVDDYRIAISQDNKCGFTIDQAKAILEMKLHKLTSLESEKLEEELSNLADEISEYINILGSKERLVQVIDEEMEEITKLYSTPRRTEISHEHSSNMEMEDLIADEDVVVTVTLGGYINSVLLDHYRTQKRGGRGRSGMDMKQDDNIIDVITTTSHTPLLFFSNKGKVYRLKVYKLPKGAPNTRGRALVNILPLDKEEKITNILPMPKDKESWDNYSIVFSTKHGDIRRNELSLFETIQSNGKNAISFEDDDDGLVGVALCNLSDNIMLATKMGKAAVFPVTELRAMKSRASTGVRGVKLQGGVDEVISMSILNGHDITTEEREDFLKIPYGKRVSLSGNNDESNTPAMPELKTVQHLTSDRYVSLCETEQFILVVTEKGFGKLTSAYDYRITKRGASGISNIALQKKHGAIIASFPVKLDNDVLVITNLGTLIRIKAKDIRVTSRNTMGVKLMNLKKNESVISTTKIAISVCDQPEEEVEEEVEA